MNKYEIFWKFFKDNEKYIIEKLYSNSDDIVLMMKEALEKIHPDLAFEIYEDTEKENMTLVVSADGMFQLFGIVEELFEYYEDIEGWDIYKFRPALDEKYQYIELDGIELSYHDVNIEVSEDFRMNAYIKGYDGKDNRYVHAYFLLLDTLIGEYDAVTLIKETEVFPYQEVGVPISEIKHIVNEYKRRR